MIKTLISEIAKNCDWLETVGEDWKGTCLDRLYQLEQLLPHGSGIDAGCKIDAVNSSSKKVIITFGFHFMDDNGMYCKWIDYKLICIPSFTGMKMNIVGQDYRGIKDYLYETFRFDLEENERVITYKN